MKDKNVAKYFVDSKHKPIKVLEFANHLEKVKKDSYKGLTKEYKVCRVKLINKHYLCDHHPLNMSHVH